MSTRLSANEINLSEDTIAILKAHRKAQIELRLLLGQGGHPTLVFSDVEGEFSPSPPGYPPKFGRQFGRQLEGG